MRTTLFAVLFAAGSVLSVTSSAFAYTWATDIIWSEGAGVSEQRDNTDNALGANDADSIDGVDFLSLGLEGYAVFDFDTSFNEIAIIYETTWGDTSNYYEAVEVYVSSTYDFDSGAEIDWTSQTSDWIYVDLFTNINGEINIDLGDEVYKYLLLVDDSKAQGDSTDGFDVNAIGVTPVPEPATMLLFGAGMASLASIRRKRK